MARRLRKKEIRKPDELVSTFEKASGFLRESWVPLAAVMGGVIVVLAGYFLWHSLGHRADARSAKLLNEALEAYHAEIATGTPAPGDTKPTFKTVEERNGKAVELFDKVVKSYGRTGAGKMAEYYKATCLMEMGKADEASAAFKAMAAKDKDGLVGSLSQLGNARLLEFRGSLEEAAAEYERLLNIQNQFLPHDVILLSRAGVLEKLGRYQDAAQAYRRLVDEYPNSPYKTDAEKAMTALEVDHGVAAKSETPAPGAEATPAAQTTPAGK